MQSIDRGFSQLLFFVCENIYQCPSQLGGSNAIKLRGWDRAFTTEIKTGAFHFSKKHSFLRRGGCGCILKKQRKYD